MKLNELCEFIVDSEHKTAPTKETGYPMIRTPNLGRAVFLLDGVRRVSAKTYEAWTRRGKPKYGDLILAREAPVGNVAMVPHGLKPCLGQRTVLIRPKHSKVDAKYLAFLIVGEEIQSRIHGMSSGATVAHLNMRDIRNLELPQLPPLPTQRKIATILSAYDDLIENNTRRIAILEEMAQAIYREWFVNFRFPGHENVKLVDSPLGQIPEGWEVSAFSEIAEFVNGFAFKPAHQEPTGKAIIKIAELKNGITAKTPFNSGESIPEKYHIKNGDVLFSWSADLDVYIWMLGEGLLNQHLFTVLPKANSSKLFLYFSLRHQMHKFRQRSLGTTMRHIKRSALSEVACCVPTDETRTAFEGAVSPLLDLKQALVTKQNNLRTTRDLLLPKLISGQLDVEHLDIDLGEPLEALDEAAA